MGEDEYAKLEAAAEAKCRAIEGEEEEEEEIDEKEPLKDADNDIVYL